MTEQTSRKSLLIGLFVVAISVLLLILISCQQAEPAGYSEEELAREATQDARWESDEPLTEEEATALAERGATAIAWVETYDAQETITAAAVATSEAEATHTSEEAASTEPALEITEMSTKVLKQDAERGVADIDFIFTVKYATAGHTAFLVCYEENVESERTPVSAESGTSEVIVHLVDFNYYGAGQQDPFCELRDASAGEVLAEAYPGADTVYGD